MWLADSIADLAAAAIDAAGDSLRAEQAVYGLDALDELRLHPVLAEGFAAAGLGVLREQPYPSQWQKKRKGDDGLPLPRERERCDIVLLEHPGLSLDDSLAREKSARRLKKDSAGTLFESAAQLDAAHTATASAGVPPQDAFWLEVKVVGQYTYTCGVPGPNSTYASQLLRGPTADLAKLAADRHIRHAALMVVLFAADRAIAEHDLLALTHRCLDRDLRIASPVTRFTPIPERIGNTVCALMLLPLRPVE